MALDLIRFFDETTPSDGPWRFVGFQDLTNTKYAGLWFRSGVTSADLVSRVNRDGPGKSVYFAIGSFAKEKHPSRKDPNRLVVSRRGEACVSMKSLVTDTDFKDHYPDAPSAVEATVELCRSTGIPLWTWLVHTGGGLHFHWCFEENVPIAAWQPVADAFKAVLLARSYKCDLMVSADRARVMRVPGTYNMKPGRGQALVEAVRNDGPLIPFGTMQAAVMRNAAGLATRTVAAVPIAGAAKQTAARTGEWLEQHGKIVSADTSPETDLAGQVQAPTGRPPADMVRIVERCRVMHEALATGGAGHPEPVWKDVLSIAAKCGDATSWAHKLSQGHPGYNVAATDTKLADRMNHGPALCKTFGQHPETAALCKGCMYRGLDLGKRAFTSPAQLGEFDNPLKFKNGFDPHADGSVWRWLPVQTAKGQDPDWKVEPFLPDYRFHNYRLDQRDDRGLFLLFDVGFRGSKLEPNEVSVNILNDKQAFFKACAPFITPTADEQTALAGLKQNWIQALRRSTTRHIEVGNKLGWIDSRGRKGFSFGDRLLWQDDLDHLEMLPGRSRQAGSIEPWLVCARRIIHGAPLQAHLPLAISVGALLAGLYDVRAAVVSLYGPSATGKSAAMSTAAAMWDKPTQFIASPSDTSNSVGRFISQHRHLPMFQDDIAVNRKDPQSIKAFINLVFNTVFGRERGRMPANAGDPVINEYCTMAGFASNTRLQELGGLGATSQQAIEARIFEFEVPQWVRPEDGKTDFEQLSNNYGHAGLEIVSYMLRNKSMVADVRRHMDEYFRHSCPDPGDVRRFILSAGSLAVSGYCILDYVFKFDAPRQAFLDMVIGNVNGSLTTDSQAHGGVVGLNRPGDELLQINLMRAANPHRIVRTDQDPAVDSGANWTHWGPALREYLVGHEAIGNGRLYLSMPAMGQWAGEHGFSPRTWMEQVLRSPICMGEKKVLLGLNTHGVSPSRVKCLVLDITKLNQL